MPATKNPFTPEEDALLASLFADGEMPRAISKRMERPESSIYRRIQTLRLSDKPKKTTARVCMCCSKSFISEGPHNRLCGRCRNLSTTPFQN